jgi:hypothetical protein
MTIMLLEVLRKDHAPAKSPLADMQTLPTRDEQDNTAPILERRRMAALPVLEPTLGLTSATQS